MARPGRPGGIISGMGRIRRERSRWVGTQSNPAQAIRIRPNSAESVGGARLRQPMTGQRFICEDIFRLNRRSYARSVHLIT
jgi:hypothetical protein